MIKAVIFDMDGVLIDSEPIHYEILNRFARKNGFFVSAEEYDSYIGTTDISMWSTIKTAHSLPHPVEELVQNHMNECILYVQNNKDVKPVSGAIELIECLQESRIKLAIASSAPRRRIEAVLEAFKLKGCFQAISSGSDVRFGKPKPDIFLHSSNALEIEPEACAVIEDSQNGVIAAKSAGMKCIAYRNPNSGNQDLSCADWVVDDLKKLCGNATRKLFL